MADLTITAANVKASSDSGTKLVQYGEAVDQGEAVYLKASDGKYWLADNGASDTAAAKGIALTPNAADGYGIIQLTGDMDLGATLTVGTIYVVSATAGKIAPEADIGTTEYVTILGTAKTAALIQLGIKATGVQHV
jgi:hypothetical protein